MNKMQSNYISEIRKILLANWDPFCIGDNPKLTDEYDSFLEPILSQLQANCSLDQLQSYLMEIETQLQAPISDAQRLRTAVELKKLEIKRSE